jgi:hypothetical protein
MPLDTGRIEGARTFTSGKAPWARSNPGPAQAKKKGFMKNAGLHDLGGRASPMKHRRNGQGKGKRRRRGG